MNFFAMFRVRQIVKNIILGLSFSLAIASASAQQPGLIHGQSPIISLRTVEGFPEDMWNRFLPLMNAAAQRHGFDFFLFRYPKADYKLFGDLDTVTDPGKISYTWIVYDQNGTLISKVSGRIEVSAENLSDNDLRVIASAAISAVTKSSQQLPEVSISKDSRSSAKTVANQR